MMYPYFSYQPRINQPARKKSSAIFPSIIHFSKYLSQETSIHGFAHIAEPDRHWMERLLWAAATCLAAYGALTVSLGQLHRYNANPTVVTLEKDYQSFHFSLPAATVCVKNRVDATKLPNVIKSYWHIDESDESYDNYSRFVHMVANSNLLKLDEYRDFQEEKFKVDLYQLVVDVMLKKETFKVLSSENKPFKWTPVMTENGICHTTNSMTIDDIAIIKTNLNETKSYPITCKYGPHSCRMVLEARENSSFYIHSPYDVLDITTPSLETPLSLEKDVDIVVIEVRSGKGVRELAPKRRGCLYTDEPTASGRQVYSVNNCRLACRSEIAMKLCGCRPFYYFYDAGPQCTPAGMFCLAHYVENLASVSGPGGYTCYCNPQCVSSYFIEISRVERWFHKWPLNEIGSVKLSIQAPKTRYTREILFNFQDLLVSFGGAAGLFLGASFISFVEIPYFVAAWFYNAVAVWFRRIKHSRKKNLRRTSDSFQFYIH